MNQKYIGEGSYGCVLQPAIECNKDASKNNKNIVKLFDDYYNWDEEVKNQLKILNIFKKNKNIIVNIVDYCKKKINEYNKEIYTKCKKIYKGDDNLIIYQIIYEYGGKDLWNLNDNNIDFKKLFIGLENVFEGFVILNNNKYIHFDIRSPNILYNKYNKQSKIIDFGFLTKMEDLFNYNNRDFFYFLRAEYPPEFNKNNYLELYNFIVNDAIINREKIYNIDMHTKLELKEIKIYMENLMKTFNNYIKNKKIKIDEKKIDIYMFGIILFELIIEYNIKKKLNLNKKEYNIILSFIKNLITFNTTKRYGPQKALNEYKKIIKILK